MNIPLVDLKAQYNNNSKEIDLAINRVLQAGWFIGGEEVVNFQQEYTKYIGTKYCIGVNSGTDALVLGLRALELMHGDEIIIPANTFIATALAASENGLKPVFVDIDEKDFGIDLADLKRKINNRTKAVIVVHLYGQSDKIDEIKKVIKESGKNIHLIEDACQAHGAFYNKKRVGNYGVFSTFSFYPGKNLGAYGDGGAIVTSDTKLARKYKLLHEYGQKEKYFHQSLGVNSRLDTLQAAILRVKLRHLEKWNKRRQEIASLYTRLISQNIHEVIPPMEFNERKSVFHLYVIRAKKRDKLLKYLHESGVGALIHYPHPLHLQKAYQHLGYKRGDFPTTEKLSNEILSLPIYPELKKEQVEYVFNKTREFYSKK